MEWLETNIPAMIAIRRAQGLSQRELAKLAGIHYSTISLIEKGNRNPSDKVGNKIAKALDVPRAAIFFTRSDDICQRA